MFVVLYFLVLELVGNCDENLNFSSDNSISAF